MSVATKIYRAPRCVIGNGPVKSIATISQGAPAFKCPRGAFGVFVGFLSDWHLSQPRT
ncbi:hypothetical protein DPMN_100936 [Dreissena polymorpha]|uniref:Uncharacterized protein n=1 Tax=Dreissena polymorpha TaxID=45954 RepID=A0A9D4R8N2_DREPO|nr:hypothetical protein DPMN_100936 [Dreissena polymorpha]